MSSCNVEALTMERFTVHFLLSSSLTLFFFMFIIFELEVNKNLSLYEFKVLCFYYLDRQFIPSQPCFLKDSQGVTRQLLENQDLAIFTFALLSFYLLVILIFF